MSSINANAQVTLTVNGKQAEDMLTKLKAKAQGLEESIAKAAAAGNKADLRKLQKELRNTKRQIDQIESATVGVEEVMKHLDHATPKELNRTLSTLRKQLNGIERGTEAWDAQTKKIRQVRAELDKVNSELREGEGFWDKFNRKLNDWQTTIAGAAAAVTGLIMAGRSAVNAYADMDAEMANVRKFTGMAANQVNQLNEEFKKIDTRTSREDLNKLAQEAGRLGKTSQQDVMGFVKAADQINVALDDLGDGATLTLSKLTNIFGDEKRYGTEQSLLKVGSVINELSQNCTASAPYLAEFAKRMAGVGSQAQMSIPQIMGFAAVLDSQGQAVEMSATALSKLIMDMFKQKDKILSATNMDANKFNAELKKSTNDGLMYLLETLSKMGNIDALAPVFKDMGENGARAAQVISALAGNLETVKWEQEEAAKAFEEGTSVTNEFNVQNTTVQAELDKARKRVTEMAVELGEKLQPVMKHVISSTTLILKIMSTVITFIGQHKAAILGVTASIVAYNIAVNASNIAFKAHYYWLCLTNVVSKAYQATLVTLKAANWALSMAVAKLTGNYAKQQLLMTDWKKVAMGMKNVYAVLLVAVVALIGGLVAYVASQNKAYQMEKLLNGIKSDASKKAVEQKQKIENLVEAMNNENLSMKDRETAAKKLNQIIPGYNAHLDKTRRRYVANKQKLDEYINSLVHLYEVMGAKDKIKELGEKRAGLVIEKREAEKELEKQKKIYDENTKANSLLGGRESHYMQTGDNISLKSYKNAVDDKDDAIKDIDNQIKTIKEVYGTDIQKQQIEEDVDKLNEDTITDKDLGTDTTTTTTKGGKSGTTSSTKNTDKLATEKAWKAKEEAMLRINYAQGKKDYEQYTRDMLQIEIDYYSKVLEHTDLTEQERLENEASFYEAKKKQSDEFFQGHINDENQRYAEEVASEKQRYVEGQVDEKTYNEALQLMELEHLRRMVFFAKRGTQEYNDALATYQDKLIADQKRRQEETEKQEEEHQKRLQEIKERQQSMKDQYFGDSRSERYLKYAIDFGTLKQVYDQELKAAEGNAKEKLRVEKAYQEALKEIRHKYRIDEDSEKANFLEDWANGVKDWLDSDGGQAITQSFDVIMQGMGNIFSGMTSLIQAETEIQTNAITKRYDAEVSKAEGNNYKVKKIEKQKEKEIAKVKQEANRKQFAMQVIQAVAQTAQNALSAYGSAASIPLVGYILAPVAAAMAVAAGAIQIAAIKKQQQASEAQGYSGGGFTPKGRVDEEVGIVHAGEWVASQKLLASPVARPMINALDYAQRTNTIGSLKADDVSRQINPSRQLSPTTAPTPIVVQTDNPALTEQLSQASRVLDSYAATLRKLNERLNEPFVTVNTVTGDTGIQQAEDEYKRLMRNKSPKSSRKSK